MEPAPATDPGVARLFRPAAVVVVGASEDRHRPGGRVLHYLLSRFPGPVYPVHPKRTTVQGVPTYPHVSAAPPADLAVVAVPAEAVTEVVADCGRHGIRYAVVLSAGFADAGPDGAARQQRLREVARAHGVRLVGPNTAGLLAVGSGLAATFASRLAALPLRDGPVALVTQSGATGSALLSDLCAAGVPVGYFCHTGNEADLEVADVVEAYARDPSIHAVGCYLETVRDPGRFAAALHAAATSGTVVAVLAAGTTAAGAAAAASHTGALTTPGDALRALLDRYGAIAVDAPYQLVDVLTCLRSGRRPRGRRVAVVTLSGGAGVMQADTAARCGLVLQPPTAELRDRLAAVVPATASVDNPFDLTGAPVSDPDLLARVLDLVGGAGCYDAVSVNLSAGERVAARLTEIVAAFVARTETFSLVTWQGVDPAVRQRLTVEGPPVLDDPVRAVTALGRLVKQASRRPPPPPAPAPATAGRAGPVPLAVPELGEWLAERGVPVAPTAYLTGPAQAEAVWARWSPGPVVAKLVAPDRPHRSDHGGVRLGISSASDLAEAVVDLLRSVGETAGGAGGPAAGPRGTCVQVQPQVPPGRHEVLLGLTFDRRFGWLLAIGFGGVLTEVVGEVRTLLAPASEPECARAVESLFGGAWVRHRRGLGPAGARSVARLAARLSHLAGDGSLTGCTALELNPVLVDATGRMVAVDWIAVP